MSSSPGAVYVGLTEIKAAADVTGTTYDSVLLRMASHASGLIDQAAGRQFWPELATRYFDGNGKIELWLPEPVLAITTLTMSDDQGYSYSETPVENTDWWASDGLEYGRSPTQLLVMNPNGSYAIFYGGRRAVKIVGVWGWHRNYTAAWQSSQDALAASITAAATTLTVADADGVDAMGLTPRFEVGQLLRIDSEYLTVTAVTAGTTNSLTVVRACNGTTAAIHAKDAVIYVWRADDLVRQATLIQAVRWFKRGQSAFQDVSAALEFGQLTYARKIDPEVEFVLLDAGLRRLSVG